MSSPLPAPSAWWERVQYVTVHAPPLSPMSSLVRELRAQLDGPAICRTIEVLPNHEYRMTMTRSQLVRLAEYARRFHFGAPY